MNWILMIQSWQWHDRHDMKINLNKFRKNEQKVKWMDESMHYESNVNSHQSILPSFYVVAPARRTSLWLRPLWPKYFHQQYLDYTHLFFLVGKYQTKLPLTIRSLYQLYPKTLQISKILIWFFINTIYHLSIFHCFRLFAKF